MQFGELVRSYSFRFGVGLLALSLLLSVLADRAISSDAALTPGEKNLGVAVLGIMFEIPILALGAAGIVSLLVSVGVWIKRSRRASTQS
jgi:hypothetical protein